MTQEEWLRDIAPWLFLPCERCGVEARDHVDIPDCAQFYVHPMRVAYRHGEGTDLFRHLRSV